MLAPIPPPAVPRRSAAVLALALGAGLAFGGCGADDPPRAAPASVASSRPEPSATPAPAPTVAIDLSDYCERMAALAGERPEAYVGSVEHRADVDRLIEVAPEAVLDPLTTYSAFLSSGAIVPDDLESKLIENFPNEVQDAIESIQAYNATAC